MDKSVNQKIHSRSGRHVGRMFEFLPSHVADYKRKTKPDDSLSAYLWSQVGDEKQAALCTGFIQGIKNGNLDPNDYGQYTVQDAIYCYSATNNWNTLEKRTDDDSLKAFFDARYKSYQKYTKSMFESWHIASPKGIDMGKAAQDYAEYEEKIASSTEYDPVYGIVAAIPCAKLWWWLANEIKGSTTNNLYQFWINDNLYPSYTKYDDLLDDYASKVDREKALEVFKNCMRGEVNFFKSATEQMKK